ncbi:MAG: hypothetical protein AB7N71_01855 [Phycisphaerae bacterium]
MRFGTWKRPVCATVVFVAATVMAANAGTKDFTLTRAIPDNVCMVAHSRTHSGTDFVKKQSERFMQALTDAHLEKDIQKMFREMAKQNSTAADEEGSAEFDAHWQKFSDMLGSVDWEALVGNEFAFAMKFEFPQVMQVVMLSQPKEGETAEVFNGLANLVKQLVGMAPEGEISLGTDGSGDSVTHFVTFAQAPFPIAITLARHQNVIMLGIGSTLPEQTLALLKDKEGTTLASTERFKNAFSALPEPEDAIVFIDMEKMFKQLNGVIDQAMTMYGPAAEAGEGTASKEKELPRKLINEFDAFDYIAEVATTQGKKTQADSLAVLKSGAESTFLYKAFCSGGNLQDPLKYVPQDASSFSAFSGLNLMAAYTSVLDFIRNHAPDGEQVLAQFEEGKKQVPFDLENDLLKLVGGKMISFSLPGKSAYAPGDWVVMLSVNNSEHAATKLNELVEFGDAMMKQQNLGAINPANIPGVEGFRTVQSPMLMMMPGMSSPTFGIKNDWFFFGSSPKVMAKAFATASGDEPNFSTNERFKTEGVKLDSEVQAASFSDMTKFGEEVSQALTMIPMMGMMIPDLNKEPAGRALVSIASKMSKVVRNLDFFQSKSSKSTFDGKTMRTVSIVNYREPPAPETTTGEEG